MADLATTTRNTRQRYGNVVPAHVLVEKRRLRAERRTRVAATIIGAAALAESDHDQRRA